MKPVFFSYIIILFLSACDTSGEHGEKEGKALHVDSALYNSGQVSGSEVGKPFYYSLYAQMEDTLGKDAKGLLHAAAVIEKHKTTTDQASLDSIFLSYQDWYEKYLQQLSKQVSDANIPVQTPLNQMTSKVMEAVNLSKNEFDSLDLKIIFPEGIPALTPKGTFLLNLFGDKVSAKHARYLTLHQRELAEPFAEDAALKISFKQVGERMTEWLDYYNQFKDSPFRKEAATKLNQYTGAFFIGLNNTPVFSYDGKREINPQARQALEAYATTYPATKPGQWAKEYLRIIDACGNKFCDNSLNFYNKEIMDYYKAK
jgi:hypothetical protein